MLSRVSEVIVALLLLIHGQKLGVKPPPSPAARLGNTVLPWVEEMGESGPGWTDR